MCRVVSTLWSRCFSGRFVQSSFNSAISYGVKKQTGKTPLEHVIAYTEEKNPERKKETCISSFEITRSEFCTIVKKQINIKSTALMEKTEEIVKEYPKKIKEVSKIEKIAKNQLFIIEGSFNDGPNKIGTTKLIFKQLKLV